MTNAELKKKIAEAPEQEWFKNISATFNFALTQSQSFSGLSAIYEFVNQQVEGWAKLGQGQLPPELRQSIIYFTAVKNAISTFTNNYFQQNTNSLNNFWQNQVANSINNIAQPAVYGRPQQKIVNQPILLYNIPQVDFLVKVYENTPNYFQGAYSFMLGTNYNINSRELLYGAILAYEFTLKDHTDITERKNAEKSSISRIRADFQKYLSESEQQLATHLNKANTDFADYVQKIDNLKTEKENLFTDWFENTKNEQWQNWFEPTVKKSADFEQECKKKIADLEETYKEKLKFEEPAKYWRDRAIELKKQGRRSLWILVGLVIIVCALLTVILWNPPEIFKTTFSDEDIDISIVVRWMLVYATLVSFLAYSIRALSKIVFSSFHLARDCEERYTLTYFYLSLLKDSAVADSERQLIMQSLFSRADTGLLKDDSSPTMPNANDMVNKVVSKKS